MATKVTKYIAFDSRAFDTLEEAEKYNSVNEVSSKKLNFSNLYRNNKEEFAKLLGVSVSDLDNKNFRWSSYNNGDLQAAIIKLFSDNTEVVLKQLDTVNGEK
jgi:alkyl hydroperoxide reductase subunit AhpC